MHTQELHSKHQCAIRTASWLTHVVGGGLGGGRVGKCDRAGERAVPARRLEWALRICTCSTDGLKAADDDAAPSKEKRAHGERE